MSHCENERDERGKGKGEEEEELVWVGRGTLISDESVDVCVWMCGCVDVWMCGRVGVWVCGCMGVLCVCCVCVCVCVWVGGRCLQVWLGCGMGCGMGCGWRRGRNGGHTYSDGSLALRFALRLRVVFEVRREEDFASGCDVGSALLAAFLLRRERDLRERDRRWLERPFLRSLPRSFSASVFLNGL